MRRKSVQKVREKEQDYEERIPDRSVDRVGRRPFGKNYLSAGSVCHHRNVHEMHYAVRCIFYSDGAGAAVSDDVDRRPAEFVQKNISQKEREIKIALFA